MGTEKVITDALLILIDEEKRYREWLRVSEFRDISQEVAEKLDKKSNKEDEAGTV